MTYQLIYSRKNNTDFYRNSMKDQMEVLGLKDEDLIVDFKMGGVEEIKNMYQANQRNNLEITAGILKKSSDIARA